MTDEGTDSQALSNRPEQAPAKPQRDAKGRLLPGSTANIRGRPKGFNQFKQQCRDAADKLLPGLIAKAEGDTDLARWLIEQGYGKASQAVENTIKHDHADMTVDEMRARVREIETELSVNGLLGTS